MKEKTTKNLTVNELAKILNINVTTVRYYNRKGLFWSERNENNYRYYDEKNIQNFKIILYLRKIGFSIEAIKKMREIVVSQNYETIVKMIHEKEEECRREIEKIEKNIKDLENYRKHMEYMNDIIKIDSDYVMFDTETNEMKKKNSGIFYIKNDEGEEYGIFYVESEISDREAVNTLYEKIEENGYEATGDLLIETLNSPIRADREDEKIKIFKIPIKSLTC